VSKGKRTRKEPDSGATSASVRSVNDKVEKSTLGDLSVLGDLKSAMENKERKTNEPEAEGEGA